MQNNFFQFILETGKMARTAVMKVWNVELGLAVHIKAPNGKYVVIDLGASEEISPAKELYYNELCKNANACVHYMVLTHPHKDHFDDILNVKYVKPKVLSRVKDYSREEIMEGAGNDVDKFNAYCDFVDEYNGVLSEQNDPSRAEALDGVVVSVFQAKKCDKSNINNFSKVVVIELDGAKIVVCGDPEIDALDELMKNTTFRNKVRESLILIAPHHGRKSSYLAEFVDLINPFLTIVSDTKKGETSVVGSYSERSKGWTVHNLSTQESDVRKCLTTRCDGNIVVRFSGIDRVLNVYSHA